MKTSQTVLLVAALLAAFTFLVPDRRTEAQQSPTGPTLPVPEGTADRPAAPPSGIPQPNGDVPQNAEVSPDSLEPEVLTHGPVHEAFAEPVVGEMDEELIVNKPPPEVIDEVPPELMPEGEDVEWIPGYWAWDDETEDYIWISGLWRRIPPGQRWVPGHWSEVEGGYTWVAGFWTGADVADLEYLPYPPETLEQGPNVAAPGDNYFWVPGNWTYQSSAYNWQPGYWAPAYDDWCWVPRRYIWTPRGALFCGGYWDYRLPRRGLLFAPVRFWHRGFWGPGYRYRPYYTINTAGLLVSLFIRPSYRHYYFGDYYAPRYRDRGFRPWHLGYDGRRRLSDPLYSFYDSYYRRRGVDFHRRMDGWHDYFHRHPDRRPERTLRVSTRDIGRGRDGDRRDFDRDSRSPIQLANSLNRLAESRDSDVRLRRIDETRRNLFEESRRQVRNLEQTRSSIERRGRGDDDRVRLSGGERRSVDDRRGGPPSVTEGDRRGRSERDQPRRDAGTSREVTGNRLELPRAIQSRSERGDSSGSRGRSDRDGRSLTPERDRRGSSERFDRSGRSTEGAPGQRERSQPFPPGDRDQRGRSDRFDRSGRGSESAPGLRDRSQQTPQTPRFDRRDGSSRSGPTPRTESRPPQVRDRSESPRLSPSIRDTPRTGPDRGRSGRIQQPSPSPRQQAPQPRIEQRSGSELRGRTESRGGSSFNRGSRSGGSPQIRSSRPPQTRSQPQFRSQPQTRRSQPQARGSSRPQMRSSSPPGRSSSRGSFRGSSRGPSDRGSSNRGGGRSGGRGRR